jgi:hypothetical protein
MRVITEEPASVRLLKASAITDIAPLRMLAVNFIKKRIILRIMPIVPHKVPYALLTSGEAIFLRSRIKIFAKKVINFFLLQKTIILRIP